MDNEQAFSFYIAQYGSYFPQESIYSMRQKVMHSGLPNVALKSTTIVWLLSFFLGSLGIDRFYLGQWLLGFLKLITCGGFSIWWFIDLFIIRSTTRKQNYNTFMNSYN